MRGNRQRRGGTLHRCATAHLDARSSVPLGLLVTTGTVTSATLMAERLLEGVIHQFAPIDLPVVVERFLDHWRPALALVIEYEFWPNLLTAAHARGIELMLLNGRISTASYRSWRYLRPVIGRLLDSFALILASRCAVGGAATGIS